MTGRSVDAVTGGGGMRGGGRAGCSGTVRRGEAGRHGGEARELHRVRAGDEDPVRDGRDSGRHVRHGQSGERSRPGRRRGARPCRHDRATLGGPHRDHLGSLRSLCVRPIDSLRQPGGAAGARRRRCGDTADAALWGRVLRLRQGQSTGDQRPVPRRDGILPLVVAEDRQDLPARHRSGMGVRGASGIHDGVLLRQRSGKARPVRLVRRKLRRPSPPGRAEGGQCLGTVRHARQRRRVGDRSLRAGVLRPGAAAGDGSGPAAVRPAVFLWRARRIVG